MLYNLKIKVNNSSSFGYGPFNNLCNYIFTLYVKYREYEDEFYKNVFLFAELYSVYSL